MVLESDDVAARSQPNDYIITQCTVNYTVWLSHVYLKVHLLVVGSLRQRVESLSFGNVPARMEVAVVVRVVA